MHRRMQWRICRWREGSQPVNDRSAKMNILRARCVRVYSRKQFRWGCVILCDDKWGQEMTKMSQREREREGCDASYLNIFNYIFSTGLRTFSAHLAFYLFIHSLMNEMRVPSNANAENRRKIHLPFHCLSRNCLQLGGGDNGFVSLFFRAAAAYEPIRKDLCLFNRLEETHFVSFSVVECAAPE